jgi:hypothetical protein
MKSLRIPSDRCAMLAAAFLGCLSAPAQETSLEPMELPASVRPLPAVAESSAGAATGAQAAADGAEEVVVQGRSINLLRERIERAEDALYAVYNDINTIEEFDIHCRLHARTGTRIPQRVCLPNYTAPLDARSARAVHRVLGGESGFDLDWQSPGAEMRYKTAQLQEHMQQLAADHPELVEAMRDLYEAMQALDPGRYGPEGEP